MQQGVLLAGVLGAALLLASMGRPDVQEVSFQHFRTHLLAHGLVDHIEVSNKSTAKVFVRHGSQRCAPHAGRKRPRTLSQDSRPCSKDAAWMFCWRGAAKVFSSRKHRWQGCGCCKATLLLAVPS